MGQIEDDRKGEKLRLSFHELNQCNLCVREPVSENHFPWQVYIPGLIIGTLKNSILAYAFINNPISYICIQQIKRFEMIICYMYQLTFALEMLITDYWVQAIYTFQSVTNSRIIDSYTGLSIIGLRIRPQNRFIINADT